MDKFYSKNVSYFIIKFKEDMVIKGRCCRCDRTDGGLGYERVREEVGYRDATAKQLSF